MGINEQWCWPSRQWLKTSRCMTQPQESLSLPTENGHMGRRSWPLRKLCSSQATQWRKLLKGCGGVGSAAAGALQQLSKRDLRTMLTDQHNLAVATRPQAPVQRCHVACGRATCALYTTTIETPPVNCAEQHSPLLS